MKLQILHGILVLALCSRFECGISMKRDRSHGIQSRSSKAAEKELVDILETSMPAVMGMLSFNETLNVVYRNFLTDQKRDSIWPKAVMETKQWFGEDFRLGELQAIETDLKKYRIIVSRCMNENTGKELTRCLSTLKDALIAGSGNVEWSREQEIPKQLNVYICFHLMELAFLQMLKIQYEKHPIDGINVDKSIKETAKDFKEKLEASMPTACEQRLQRISSLDLCKVTDVLWQEFKLKCEERVRKRSVGATDSGSGGEEDEPEAITRSTFVEDNYGKLKSSKLGGSQDDFVESVRAKVKDRVTGQYIYNKR